MNANLILTGLLNSRDPITIILTLAFLSIALSTPLAVILSLGGYSRGIKSRFPLLYISAPVYEELIFRWYLLTVPLAGFEALTAVLISTVIYSLYMAIFYGSPAMGEGIATGILFGLAFFQVGIVPLIIAHIIYRIVLKIWAW